MGIPASSTSAIAATDAVVDNIHDTDLPAVKTVVDGVETHVHSIETKLDATIVKVDDLHDTDIPDIHTDVADVHTDVGTAITKIDVIDALVDGTSLNRMPDTPGDRDHRRRQLRGTRRSAPSPARCSIEDVIVKMVTYHADLTVDRPSPEPPG